MKQTSAEIALAPPARAVSPKKVLSLFRGAPLGPTAILLAVLVAAIFAPLLAPYDPTAGNVMVSLTPPSWQKGGSTAHILGTDMAGRDVLSRIVYGARVSMIVGFVAVGVSGFIGAWLALLSGYLGGWADSLIMRLTDAMLSMPFLLIALALAGILGASLMNIIVILGFIGWAQYARVLRGEVLRVKQNDFIRLAVVAGCSNTRILLRHIFPNIMNTLVVLATLQLGMVIIAEASLSFLGLGVPPPQPAWGLMLADGRMYIEEAWWLSVFPGLAILLTVLATNLLGDWLRVRLDPKYRQL